MTAGVDVEAESGCCYAADSAVTIGCVPVGDDAIEDIFYLASAVGIKNVSVVIAPYAMRKSRKPELERSPLKRYPNLCDEIHTALSGAI